MLHSGYSSTSTKVVGNTLGPLLTDEDTIAVEGFFKEGPGGTLQLEVVETIKGDLQTGRYSIEGSMSEEVKYLEDTIRLGKASPLDDPPDEILQDFDKLGEWHANNPDHDYYEISPLKNYLVLLGGIDQQKGTVMIETLQPGRTDAPYIFGNDLLFWHHLKRYNVESKQEVKNFIMRLNNPGGIEEMQEIVQNGSLFEKTVLYESLHYSYFSFLDWDQIIDEKRFDTNNKGKRRIQIRFLQEDISGLKQSRYFARVYLNWLDSMSSEAEFITGKQVFQLGRYYLKDRDNYDPNGEVEDQLVRLINKILPSIQNRVTAYRDLKTTAGNTSEEVPDLEDPPELERVPEENHQELLRKFEEAERFFWNHVKHDLFSVKPWIREDGGSGELDEWGVYLKDENEHLREAAEYVYDRVEEIGKKRDLVPARREDESRKNWDRRVFKQMYPDQPYDPGEEKQQTDPEKNSVNQEQDREGLEEGETDTRDTSGENESNASRVDNGDETRATTGGEKDNTRKNNEEPEGNTSEPDSPQTSYPLWPFVLIALAGAGTLGIAYVLSTRGS